MNNNSVVVRSNGFSFLVFFYILYFCLQIIKLLVHAFCSMQCVILVGCVQSHAQWCILLGDHISFTHKKTLNLTRLKGLVELSLSHPSQVPHSSSTHVLSPGHTQPLLNMSTFPSPNPCKRGPHVHFHSYISSLYFSLLIQSLFFPSWIPSLLTLSFISTVYTRIT